MVDGPLGPRPAFGKDVELPALAWDACPGKGIDYPRLYREHYECLPANWLLGNVETVRSGFSADAAIQKNGASGGILSHVLVHLLESRAIDGAIVVRQGIPDPASARVQIARSRAEILAASQSVYVPVSVLDVLGRLESAERYAMTCLPDQAASLRVLQHAGFAPAGQVRYVLGPYTGTALYPEAIRCYLRSKRVADDDAITSLRWRAGDWPGHLEISLRSGRILRSPKVYYNYLIPFFVTQSSLQSIDFANEFADLAVGDAWSPKYEAAGIGRSLLTTRTPAMEAVIRDMEARGLLVTEPEEPLQALEMHGHMLDFKKRGSAIRNRIRVFFGLRAPDYGIGPARIPASRLLVELVIFGLFVVCGTRPARALAALVPERILGPLFDRLRLGWKRLSRPTKRRGLRDLTMEIRSSP